MSKNVPHFHPVKTATVNILAKILISPPSLSAQPYFFPVFQTAKSNKSMKKLINWGICMEILWAKSLISSLFSWSLFLPPKALGALGAKIFTVELDIRMTWFTCTMTEYAGTWTPMLRYVLNVTKVCSKSIGTLCRFVHNFPNFYSIRAGFNPLSLLRYPCVHMWNMRLNITASFSLSYVTDHCRVVFVLFLVDCRLCVSSMCVLVAENVSWIHVINLRVPGARKYLNKMKISS